MANQGNNQVPALNKPPGAFSMRGVILIILSIVVCLGLLILSWRYPFAVNETTAEKNKDLFLTLAPFIAIATFIERFWETFFNWYESIALQVGRLIGVSAKSIGWMRTEIKNAEQVVEDLIVQLNVQKPGDGEYEKTWSLLQQAEERLLDAEGRIGELLKSSAYTSIKKAITLGGSLIIGLCMSFSWNLQLLHAAGFTSISPGPDLLITGLLIGAGPGPLHSFIGTLQEFRNTLAGLADLARGSAVKKAAEALTGTTQPAPPTQTVVVTQPTPAAPVIPPGGLNVQVRNEALDAQPQLIVAAPEVVTVSNPAVGNLRLQRQAERMLRLRR